MTDEHAWRVKSAEWMNYYLDKGMFYSAGSHLRAFVTDFEKEVERRQNEQNQKTKEI